MNGKGLYKLPNGAIYKGNFKENKRTGKGVYTFPKNDLNCISYQGDFLNG